MRYGMLAAALAIGIFVSACSSGELDTDSGKSGGSGRGGRSGDPYGHTPDPNFYSDPNTLSAAKKIAARIRREGYRCDGESKGSFVIRPGSADMVTLELALREAQPSAVTARVAVGDDGGPMSGLSPSKIAVRGGVGEGYVVFEIFMGGIASIEAFAVEAGDDRRPRSVSFSLQSGFDSCSFGV
jgi:hypothetical protein